MRGVRLLVTACSRSPRRRVDGAAPRLGRGRVGGLRQGRREIGERDRRRTVAAGRAGARGDIFGGVALERFNFDGEVRKNQGVRPKDYGRI